jgi:hypothetical protein
MARTYQCETAGVSDELAETFGELAGDGRYEAAVVMSRTLYDFSPATGTKRLKGFTRSGSYSVACL